MPQHIGHGGFSDTALLARLGTPAGASLAADVAAVKADTAAVLVDTGDGTDAAVGPGIAGSLHAHVREAQADLDTTLTRIGAPAVSLTATLGTPAGASLAADVAAVKTDTAALLVDTGDGTDAAVGPGNAGTLHGHIREAQEQADSIFARLGAPAGASMSADVAALKTDTAALLVDTGDGADAAVGPGLAGSLHAHLREAQVDLDSLLTALGTIVELASVVGMIGKGDNAEGTAGAAAESLHAKLRAILADSADMQPKLGTMTNTGGTATLGAILGDANNSALFTRIGAIVELSSLVGMIGKGDDASGSAGTAGQSLHSKLRKAITDTGNMVGRLGTPTELSSVVGMIGVGSDAAGTTGTAGQSLHSKLRMLMAGLGAPSQTTLADQMAALEGAIDISGLAILDGGFTHTTTQVQSSSLSANDLYAGQRCTVIKVVGASGRPERTTRTVSSYDTANRRLTLDSALPWTPVNGDQLVVLAKLA